MRNVNWWLDGLLRFISHGRLRWCRNYSLAFGFNKENVDGRHGTVGFIPRECIVKHNEAYTLHKDGSKTISPTPCRPGRCRRYFGRRVWVYGGRSEGLY